MSLRMRANREENMEAESHTTCCEMKDFCRVLDFTHVYRNVSMQLKGFCLCVCVFVYQTSVCLCVDAAPRNG